MLLTPEEVQEPREEPALVLHRGDTLALAAATHFPTLTFDISLGQTDFTDTLYWRKSAVEWKGVPFILKGKAPPPPPEKRKEKKEEKIRTQSKMATSRPLLMTLPKRVEGLF